MTETTLSPAATPVLSTTRLFVSGLAWKTDDNSLQTACAELGNIKECRVLTYNGRSRGFGFVEFASPEDAQAACAKLDGLTLDERQIHSEFSRERVARSEDAAASPKKRKPRTRKPRAATTEEKATASEGKPAPARQPRGKGKGPATNAVGRRRRQATGAAARMPIVAAIQANDIEGVRKLVDGGEVSLEENCTQGRTPLHWAAYSGAVEIADYLLAKGSKVEARSADNRTPMHSAAISNNGGMIELLHKHGAGLDSGDEHNRAPLHLAEKHRSVEAARKLLDLGANVEAQDSRGRKPTEVGWVCRRILKLDNNRPRRRRPRNAKGEEKADESPKLEGGEGEGKRPARKPRKRTPKNTHKSAAPPAKKDDDDEIDLFGGDDDGAEYEAQMAKKRAEAADKKKSAQVQAKSSIVLDVKPWDDTTKMDELEQKVRSVQIDGLVWGASKLVEIGYGIKKLQISLVIVDDLVSLDDIEEKIVAFEDHVQSTDVVAFNKV